MKYLNSAVALVVLGLSFGQVPQANGEAAKTTAVMSRLADSDPMCFSDCINICNIQHPLDPVKARVCAGKCMITICEY